MIKQEKAIKQEKQKIHRWSMLGERIAVARRAAGILPADLSRACDVERATVSYWEIGKYRPTDDNLYSISDALSVSVEELIRGTGIKMMVNEKTPADGEQVDLKTLKPHDVAILKMIMGSKKCQVWRLTSDAVSAANYFEGQLLIVATEQDPQPKDIVLALIGGVPVFRLFLDPQLMMIPAGRSAPASVKVDGSHVVIKGVVIDKR